MQDVLPIPYLPAQHRHASVHRRDAIPLGTEEDEASAEESFLVPVSRIWAYIVHIADYIVYIAV